jgi:hypothetical protein
MTLVCLVLFAIILQAVRGCFLNCYGSVAFLMKNCEPVRFCSRSYGFLEFSHWPTEVFCLIKEDGCSGIIFWVGWCSWNVLTIYWLDLLDFWWGCWKLLYFFPLLSAQIGLIWTSSSVNKLYQTNQRKIISLNSSAHLWCPAGPNSL